MKRRRLGGQGLEVAALGLGCMGMSAIKKGATKAESLATIHMALERGLDVLDPADMYGPWTKEERVGRTLRGRRERVVLATKFGFVRGADGSFRGVNGRPDRVRACCEASLKRLGVDHADLYDQHRVDRGVPIEETVGAMAELVKAGKILFLGLAETSPTPLHRAHAVQPITALQME